MIHWPLLLLTYSTMIMLGLIDNSRGPAFPQILDYFHTSAALGSNLFAMASLGSLLSTLMARWWLRFPAKSIALIFIMIEGLSSLGMGLPIIYPMACSIFFCSLLLLVFLMALWPFGSISLYRTVCPRLTACVPSPVCMQCMDCPH